MGNEDVNLRFRLTGEDVSAGKALEGVGKEVEKSGTKMKALGGIGLAAGAAAGGMLAKGFADNMNLEVASDKLTAQLGLSTETSAKAGKLASAAYADNWGSDMNQVNEAIRSVGTNMADLNTTSDADLKMMTESALALAATFDVDVNASTQAAGKLMKTGLADNAQEAFDVITAGFQAGLDPSGDWLDTINEYSTQFRQLGLVGLDAETLIKQGMDAGARDADVVADALKEFALKTQGALEQADSKGRLHLTALGQAFESVGISGKAMYDAQNDLAKGGEPAREAFVKMTDGLRGIQDPAERTRTAVALFGTKAEDMGQALYALDLNKPVKGFEDITGATDRMAAAVGDNAQGKIDTMKRKFEQFTQGLAGAKGPMGDVTAGALAFGGPVLGMAGSIGAAVTGLSALNMGMIATKAGQIAGAAATGIATAAQWLWNAALTANPIGLIIVAIVALVAGLVWFFTQTKLGREIVSAAMEGIRISFGWVMDKVTALWNWVKQNWPLLLTIFTGPIGLAVKFITDNWDKIVTYVKALPGRITSGASGMWDGIWNGFKGVINKIIGGWNSLHFSVPSFTFLGVTTPGFNLGLPGIPYLARGAVATGPTLAMIGEAGTEAVVPLDRAGEFGFGGGGNITVNVTNAVVGNEDALVRAVGDALRRSQGRGYGVSFA